jgi:hypothetical protein
MTWLTGEARRLALEGLSWEAAPACLRFTGAANSELGASGWNS